MLTGRPNKSNLVVVVEPALVKAVREAARAEGSDVSKIVRELITAYAEDAGTLKPRPRRELRRLEQVSA